MPKKSETVEEKLDHLARIAQDMLILQALQAGIGSHQVAAIAKIDKARVSRISKHLKVDK